LLCQITYFHFYLYFYFLFVRSCHKKMRKATTPLAMVTFVTSFLILLGLPLLPMSLTCYGYLCYQFPYLARVTFVTSVPNLLWLPLLLVFLSC
jgi:hypothetical protein